VSLSLVHITRYFSLVPDKALNHFGETGHSKPCGMIYRQLPDTEKAASARNKLGSRTWSAKAKLYEVRIVFIIILVGSFPAGSHIKYIVQLVDRVRTLSKDGESQFTIKIEVCKIRDFFHLPGSRIPTFNNGKRNRT